MRLGGVARDPLPHPARGLASARPPHLPHRPRQSSRGRPIGPAAQPPAGGGGPRRGGTKRAAGAPRHTTPASPPAAPALAPHRAPAPQTHRPFLTAPRNHLAPARQTAEARSGEMAAVGEGSPGNVPRPAIAGPSVPRQPTKRPAPLSQARLARPCSPREFAVASRPRRLRRSVTARQRTRTIPLPPQRRAPLAAQASAVVRGRSDWPKAASITAPRTPPSAGDSLWAVRPRA